MTDLFTRQLDEAMEKSRSLAARMRPQSLEEFAGQQHLLAPGKPLRAILDKGMLANLVFWGPPGIGKTTLARIIASRADAEFEEYSAVTSKVSDIRSVVEAAKRRLASNGRRTIVFVDEFHRFNKMQQDAFLPHLESGLLFLIGATTENPYFALNPALRSRVSIFRFNRLDDEAMRALLERAAPDAAPDAAEEMLRISNGDARVLLNLFEMAAATLPQGAPMTPEHVRETACQRNLDYQRLGTDRFDMVSAMIKRLRGSDPDAAMYWMVRLLEGGEAPEFIARRFVIFAAEDVGMAQPNAITVAAATVDAVAFTGMPEAEIPLANCCVFLATSPKSNSAYMALHRAKKALREKPLGPVPLHLRNYDFTDEKQGDKDAYKYPHDFPGHWVDQEYLPPGLEGSVFYHPSDLGHEKRAAENIARLRAVRNAAARDGKKLPGDSE